MFSQFRQSVCPRQFIFNKANYYPCRVHQIQLPRWHSTVSQDGPPVTETNRVEATLKRFWDKVGIERRDDAFAVTLDGRPLKTPSGNKLHLPLSKSLLTTLIAAEWDHQHTLAKVHSLPVTSLAARAIDSLKDPQTRDEVYSSLIKYLNTDAICFYQDYPPQLEALQKEHWDPLHEWVEKTYDVKINKSESVLFIDQPEESKKKLAEVMKSFDHWQLAAMERATFTSKSFIIALALVTGRLDVDQAARASHVEVDSQIQRWGEVEDTHDVDYHDVRRQLGSVGCLLSNA